MREGHEGIQHHEVDAAPEHVDDRGRAALVRDVHHVDRGHALQHLAREVLRAARPGGGVVELPGLGLGEADHVGERLRIERRRRHQDERRIAHVGDGCEIPLDIEGEIAKERRIGREPVRGDEHRVPIGR